MLLYKNTVSLSSTLNTNTCHIFIITILLNACFLRSTYMVHCTHVPWNLQIL